MALCYTLAMSDHLLKQWYAFKHAQAHDAKLIEKLLALYKPLYLTNVAQLQRIGVHDPALITQLAQSGMVNQNLAELTQRTVYKILLTNQSGDYPVVNIMRAQPNAEYVYTFQKGENRTRVHDHLRALLRSARSVLICDKYLQANWRSVKKLFDFFPNQSLSLVFSYDFQQSQKSELKRMHQNWKITLERQGNYKGLHDRYMLIDHRVELIFTSGLDYLFDMTKECTVIIRLNA